MFTFRVCFHFETMRSILYLLLTLLLSMVDLITFFLFRWTSFSVPQATLNCQMNVNFFFYAVYSVLLSIVACLWVFTLKLTIPLFYCPSQVVFHSINYSIIVFSSIPLIIFFQFQDSISAPACIPVPLTKIFRSIILILRRICLNFQQ